jgi:hypothetical protein
MEIWELAPNAPAELRPTGENAVKNPQSLRCGPSAPVGCSVRRVWGAWVLPRGLSSGLPPTTTAWRLCAVPACPLTRLPHALWQRRGMHLMCRALGPHCCIGLACFPHAASQESDPEEPWRTPITSSTAPRLRVPLLGQPLAHTPRVGDWPRPHDWPSARLGASGETGVTRRQNVPINASTHAWHRSHSTWVPSPKTDPYPPVKRISCFSSHSMKSSGVILLPHLSQIHASGIGASTVRVPNLSMLVFS